MHHIRDCLPELRMKVNSTLSQTRQEIAALGDPRLNKSKVTLKGKKTQLSGRLTFTYHQRLRSRL